MGKKAIQKNKSIYTATIAKRGEVGTVIYKDELEEVKKMYKGVVLDTYTRNELSDMYIAALEEAGKLKRELLNFMKEMPRDY